jgi:hypothetical protein
MGLSPISLSLASTPSHILAVVSFKRPVGGGGVWCNRSNLSRGVVADTRGCEQWHDASLTRYGRTRWDTRERYGFRRVKCHGRVVG